ncbi:hypothetical protein [Methylorubrum populi]|uniref:hypothetical protein n=1 Tax=Methylorubrum populi TaxID=223967 RepID=UPI002353976B|nr:hypothetical protein [Methylorubrum populi]
MVPGKQSTQFNATSEIAASQQGADGLKVTTYSKNKHCYDVVSSADSFANIAYNRFDLSQVCRILLHKNPSFSGHKDALAAALCGWMLGSTERVARRRLIALSVGKTLARAKRSSTKREAKRSGAKYDYPLTTNLPPAFFNELYYPIGGLRTLVKTPAYYGLLHELAIQRDRLYDTINLAATDHCHQLSTATHPDLDNLSIDRSCEAYLLVELNISGSLAPDVANLKAHYLNFLEQSIPFLYAASTIMISDKQSLLGAVATAKWAAILRPGILSELVGRTLFYAQNVYAKNDKAKERVIIARKISDALRDIEPIAFDPPDRVKACSRIIEHIYTEAGYNACHDDKQKLFWNSPAFWSALNLPVPVYKGRPRSRIV